MLRHGRGRGGGGAAVREPHPDRDRDQRSTNMPYAHEPVTKTSAAKPTVVTAKPSRIVWREPIRVARSLTNGETTIRPTVAGSVASPASSGLMPEAGGVLEVEADDVHQAVDRASPDQDRQRRADEHLVAQQAEVEQRRLHAPLDGDEAEAGGDREREAAERQRRAPAPVGPLREREHGRHERQGDQQRAGDVDRARPRRVARLRHGRERQRDAERGDRGVDPEQAPASRSCRRARRRRAGRPPRRPPRRRPRSRRRASAPRRWIRPTAGSSRRPAASSRRRPGSRARRSRPRHCPTGRSARRRRRTAAARRRRPCGGRRCRRARRR